MAEQLRPGNAAQRCFVDTREKTASIAIGLNVLLTGLKFALYAVTGSLAILAEAWHSFSDIATSGMTWLAVRRTVVSEAEVATPSDRSDASDASQADVSDTSSQPRQDPASDVSPGADASSMPRSTFRPSADQIAALVIGLVILLAGLGILRRVLWWEAVEISRPLVAGVLFFVFAVGSYLVHRLEIDVGERTGSSGLVADGNHAWADMIASLLTGVSLVLYHLGINLDRWIAAAIGVLVLSVALETLINLAVALLRRETRYVPRYRSHELLTSALSLSWLSERVGEGGGLFASPAVKRIAVPVRRWTPAVVVLVAVVSYGRTCFFSVGLNQVGMVEHLGRTERTGLEPGLHVKWPWPIDRAVLVETSVVQAANVGNETHPSAFALIWTREHGTEVPFLAGDKNLFFPYVIVHWRVKDPLAAVYQQQEPHVLLDAVCHRMMTELCAGREFYQLASTYREQLAADLHRLAQQRLDELGSGLEILNVNLSDIHPPVRIADAFEEVVVARFQQQQQMVNEALGLRNEQLPDARGRAAMERADAAAYHLEQTHQAEGEAAAFKQRVEALNAGRAVTLKHLYLEAVAAALRGIEKVLIDEDIERPDLWMGAGRRANSAVSPQQKMLFKDIREQME